MSDLLYSSVDYLFTLHLFTFRPNITSTVSEETDKLRAIVDFFRRGDKFRGEEPKGREGLPMGWGRGGGKKGGAAKGKAAAAEGEGLTPAIIYCSYKREVEALASYLQTQGFDVAAYHAGIDPGIKLSKKKYRKPIF